MATASPASTTAKTKMTTTIATPVYEYNKRQDKKHRILHILPDVEKTPLLLIRFNLNKVGSSRNNKNNSNELLEYIEKLLLEAGLIILSKQRGGSSSGSVEDDKNDNNSYIDYKLTATQNALEKQAEYIHLMKYNYKYNIIDKFTVENRNEFCNMDLVANNENTNQPRTMKNSSHSSYIYYRDKYHLFSSNDWALLITRIVDHIEVYLQDNNNKIPDVILPYLKKIKNSSSSSDNNVEDTNNIIHSRSLRRFLIRNQLVSTILTLHIQEVRDNILYETYKTKWYNIIPPVQIIRDYYGEQIAFYFVWIGYMSTWMLFPGIIGLFFFLLRNYRNDTIDDDEYTPFFSIIMFLWSICFLKFYDRYENYLSVKWGTYTLSKSNFDKHKFLAYNEDYIGTRKRISPVTGLPENYYPTYKRQIQYVISGCVTFGMLLVAFQVMILSLNIQGYIRPQSNPKRWNAVSNPHPFHYPSLAILAEEEQLFDMNSTYKCYIPVIIHAISIMTLNNIYRSIATKLTELENHETHNEYENSIVIKRFLFEAFDCYVALFYLAFYERDMDKLRMELIAIFNIDVLRRLLLESVVPTITQYYTKIMKRRKKEKKKATTAPVTNTTINSMTDYYALGNKTNNNDENEIDDADKEVYEQFDDYIEIVIQLGYITLFASAYPLASLIAVIDNYIEIRSDMYKLCKVCQRPRPYRTDGIGEWKMLIKCIIWLSALTNCLLVGFTSSQLMQYWPNLYIEDDNGDAHLVHDKGWITVFIIFGLERILIVIGLLIQTIIPSIPEDVHDQIDRLHYIQSQQQHEMYRSLKISKNPKKEE